ncbi:MAG TPA: hypothetical protein VF665_02400 [Longimicrobium sp.]|jgi:hypothetical protein|uniref:hypothetical protein n=1 Tax=Longimicrobium sp. TaxID=2029185 RepID=UPI002ED9204B
MLRSLLTCGTALLLAFATPGTATAQTVHPSIAFAPVWDARLTPEPVTPAGQGADPQSALIAGWRRPVWVLPAAGAVVGGFAGLLYHNHLCRDTECSGPPALIPLGAVAGVVITAVLQKEIRRARRNQPEARS